MLSVSVLSVPRCAAATLLLLLLRLIVTVGDGLAPAVDSVVVTPRKTVEPRFNQRKKCVETDDALHTATKPDCLCPRQFGASFTAGAAAISSSGGPRRFTFQNIGKSEKLSNFYSRIYDTRSLVTS